MYTEIIHRYIDGVSPYQLPKLRDEKIGIKCVGTIVNRARKPSAKVDFPEPVPPAIPISIAFSISTSKASDIMLIITPVRLFVNYRKKTLASSFFDFLYC